MDVGIHWGPGINTPQIFGMTEVLLIFVPGFTLPSEEVLLKNTNLHEGKGPAWSLAHALYQK